MAPVIEVRDLRKSYGGVERLHGISFSVEVGQILGFLGMNGAGKTTTVEILEGYRRRDSGDVRVLGVDPAHPTRAWRNRIGLVLQDSEIQPNHTVVETIRMFAKYFDAPTDVEQVMASAGLVEQARERVGRLSGGQKRKVEVALGLVGDPEVLFLDEPTTGLDPTARREMWRVIEGLRDAGRTVILTTHYMDEAQQLADHIIVMRAGTIVAEGSPDELSRSLGIATHISFPLPADAPIDALANQVSDEILVAGGSAHLRSIEVQRDLPLLLAWAEREGVDLSDLRVARPTLDDVFVHLAEEHHDGD